MEENEIADDDPDGADEAKVTSVWQDKYIEKYNKNINGKIVPYWRCKWCNKEFKQHNSTKAIYHLTGMADSSSVTIAVSNNSSYYFITTIY